MKTKDDILDLVKEAKYGAGLYGWQVEVLISFALDNYMGFEEDFVEAWRTMFERVVKKKLAHYKRHLKPPVDINVGAVLNKIVFQYGVQK